VLEFDPDVRGGYGYAIARDILESGRALEKMEAIIEAQGRQEQSFAPGALTFEVCADRAGVVTAIDNFILAKIARLAGAPMNKGAGVDLLRKLGEPVAEGEALYRVHAEYRAEFNFARTLTGRDTGYAIGAPDEITRTYMEF